MYEAVPMYSAALVQLRQHKVSESFLTFGRLFAEALEEALHLFLGFDVVMALVSMCPSEEPRTRVREDLPVRSERPLVSAGTETARAVPASNGQLLVHVLRSCRPGAALAIGDGSRVGQMNRGRAVSRHAPDSTFGRVTGSWVSEGTV